MKKQFFPLIGLAILFMGVSLMVSRCGTDDAAASTTLSRAMGLVAVTSPTASSSRTSLGNVLFSGPESVKPMDEMLADMKNFRDAPDINAAAQTLGNPIGTNVPTDAECYGPPIHDGTKNRPSRDLGLFYSTASKTDNTACAVAQMNALSGGAPQFINKFIGLQGLMIKAASDAGNQLPAVGETIDAKAVMPTIDGLTISEAKLDRLADDADDKEVYRTSFIFVKSTDATATGWAKIYHTPLNADNTNFKGLFQAVLPHVDGLAGLHSGMSMVYQQTGDILYLSLRIVNNADNGPDSEVFFGSDGLVDFTAAGYGNDANYMIAQFNTTTNAAVVHYAWEASEGDHTSRNYAINAPIGTRANGVAYYGYSCINNQGCGNEDSIRYRTAASVPWPEGMRCAWPDSPIHTAEVQKQEFSLTDFTVVSENIDYGLETDCTGAYNVTACTAGNNCFGTTPPWMVGLTRTDIADDLTTPPTTADVPAVTEPTYTLPTR